MISAGARWHAFCSQYDVERAMSLHPDPTGESDGRGRLLQAGPPSTATARRVIELAVEATPLAEHRRPTKDEQQQGRAKTSTRGETAEYLTRRIARDRPDILERMKRGEFRSVRAAAKAAGLVRELSTLEQLERLWNKASPAERTSFRRRVLR